MKSVFAIIIIVYSSIALADKSSQKNISSCEASVKKEYLLSEDFDGELLFNKIMGRFKSASKEQVLAAKYSFKNEGVPTRVEFTYLENEKVYSVQSNSKNESLFPKTTVKIEDVTKKISGPKDITLKISSYHLKEGHDLLVYRNSKKITRVALGKEFSCEFTDFTSCMCVQ